MAENWQVLSSEVVYEGRFRVVKDLLRRPDGGNQEYTWIPSDGAVAVLAFDAEGRVVLTRQYRHPLGLTIFDLPAGGIKPGESEQEAARRELREETGYLAEKLTRIGAFYHAPGRLATAVTVFVAEGLEAGPTELDDEELIEVVPTGWPEVLDLVRTSEQPVDSSSLRCPSLARDWRQSRVARGLIVSVTHLQNNRPMGPLFLVLSSDLL